jgi:hypothetical protein
MPPTALDKALIGVAGAAGVGVLAWQTKFPWIKYDLQILKVLRTFFFSVFSMLISCVHIYRLNVFIV